MWICACKVRAKAARELGRGRTRKRVGGGRGPGRNVTPCDFLNSFRQRTEHSAFLIGRQSVNLSADVRFPLDTKEDCRLYCCLQHCSILPDSCHFRSQNYSLTFQDQGHVAKKKRHSLIWSYIPPWLVRFSVNIVNVLHSKDAIKFKVINNYSSSPCGLWINSPWGGIEGRMGYCLRGQEGERNNYFSKDQLVGQKYRE